MLATAGKLTWAHYCHAKSVGYMQYNSKFYILWICLYVKVHIFTLLLLFGTVKVL